MNCDDKECIFYDEALGQCMADDCIVDLEKSFEN